MMINSALLLILVASLGCSEKGGHSNPDKDNIDLDTEKSEYPCSGELGYRIKNEIVCFNYKQILEADVDTFDMFGSKDSFAKDKNNIYYRGNIFTGSSSGEEGGTPITLDLETFKVIPKSRNAADKNYVFFGEKLIVGADPATFKMVGRSYATDKNYVYYGSERLEFLEFEGQGPTKMDPNTFKILSEGGFYATDGNFVVFISSLTPEADAKSFEVLEKSSQYAKDKDRVFYRGTSIDNADPMTFVLIGSSGPLARDKQRAYYFGQIVEVTDVNLLRIIGKGFWTDETSVFYELDKIVDADAATFVLGDGGKECTEILTTPIRLTDTDPPRYDTASDKYRCYRSQWY